MLEVFFPSHCRICHLPLPKGKRFCSLCSKDFSLIDPAYRCIHCFSQAHHICKECEYDYELKDLRIAYCWDGILGVPNLIKEVRRGRLAKLMSDVLYVQHHRMKWGDPDVVIPIPGMAHKEYIYMFARKLGVPCRPWLYKEPGSLPQWTLPLRERACMPMGLIDLKPNDAYGKKILLVDDTVGTYETIKAAERVLKQAGARQIDALVLARVFVED